MWNEARHQRQGQRDVAPKHVTQRQIDDGSVLLLRQRRIVGKNIRGGGEVLAMGDECAFGIPGGTGCVDDEGGLLGLDLRYDGAERVEIGRFYGSKQLAIAPEFFVLVGEHRAVIDDEDEAQVGQTVGKRQDLVDIFLVFGDEDRGAAMAHLVLDLRCRGSGIDAVNDCAERLRGEIADHPFFARIAHDGDAFASTEAEALQRTRRMRHQPRIITPVTFAIKTQMLGPEGDRIRRRFRALAQQERCSLAAQYIIIGRQACGRSHNGIPKRSPNYSIAQ